MKPEEEKFLFDLIHNLFQDRSPGQDKLIQLMKWIGDNCPFEIDNQTCKNRMEFLLDIKKEYQNAIKNLFEKKENILQTLKNENIFANPGDTEDMGTREAFLLTETPGVFLHVELITDQEGRENIKVEEKNVDELYTQDVIDFVEEVKSQYKEKFLTDLIHNLFQDRSPGQDKLIQLMKWIGDNCPFEMNNQTCKNRMEVLLKIKEKYPNAMKFLFEKKETILNTLKLENIYFNPGDTEDMGTREAFLLTETPGVFLHVELITTNRGRQDIKVDEKNVDELLEEVKSQYNPSSKTTSTKNPIAIVTDFDNTLTTNHYFYFLHDHTPNKELESLADKINNIIQGQGQNLKLNQKEHNLLLDYIFGGQMRFDAMVQFLKKMKANNIPVFISSHGYCEDMDFLLNEFKIKNLFQSPIGCRATDNIQKNIFIQNNVLPKNNIVFYLDDDNSYFDRIRGQPIIYFGKDIIDMRNDATILQNFGLIKEGDGLSIPMFNQIDNMIDINFLSGQGQGQEISKSSKENYIESLIPKMEQYEIYNPISSLSVKFYNWIGGDCETFNQSNCMRKLNEFDRVSQYYGWIFEPFTPINHLIQKIKNGQSEYYITLGGKRPGKFMYVYRDGYNISYREISYEDLNL
jgi:hypothetical protein